MKYLVARFAVPATCHQQPNVAPANIAIFWAKCQMFAAQLPNERMITAAELPDRAARSFQNGRGEIGIYGERPRRGDERKGTVQEMQNVLAIETLIQLNANAVPDIYE